MKETEMNLLKFLPNHNKTKVAGEGRGVLGYQSHATKLDLTGPCLWNEMKFLYTVSLT